MIIDAGFGQLPAILESRRAWILEPDITVFAKGMSNDYPMSAIIGKSNVMKVAEKTFISSTYWIENIR